VTGAAQQNRRSQACGALLAQDQSQERWVFETYFLFGGNHVLLY